MQRAIEKGCPLTSPSRGSTIAKVVAENTRAYPDLFEPTVQMWVHEEQVTIPPSSKHHQPSNPPQPLSQLINQLHENVKYLPNITLPENVVANPSIEDAVKDSTILIFNLPHQFVPRICNLVKGKILPYARGISCIKGVEVNENGMRLICDRIGEALGIYCGALSGANIATEIALEKWSETTIAYEPPQMDSRQPSPSGSPSASQVNLVTPETAQSSAVHVPKLKLQAMPAEYPPLTHDTMKKLFHRPYFHVRLVSDTAGVSLGGALKNIVALAAGFVDGLGWGDNAKSAIMRVGILEMVKFGEAFFSTTHHTRASTFTEESCGVADVVTSCFGGRNFRCAKLAIERGVSVEKVEETELNGQKLQGISTAREVNEFLKAQNMENDFPLFTAVYSEWFARRLHVDLSNGCQAFLRARRSRRIFLT